MGFSLLLGSVAFPMARAGADSEDKQDSAAPSAQADEPPSTSHVVTLTAYNAVPGQTDGDPLVTASGAFSNPEVMAARSRDLAGDMPFGTIIELDGSTVARNNTCGYSVVAPKIGYRVIGDTMNARYTDRIDVLFDVDTDYVKPNGAKMNAANVLGICNGITVRVVGRVDINHIPKTQAELAALVHNKGAAIALK